MKLKPPTRFKPRVDVQTLILADVLEPVITNEDLVSVLTESIKVCVGCSMPAFLWMKSCCVDGACLS